MRTAFALRVMFAITVALIATVGTWAETTVFLQFRGQPPPAGIGPTQAEKDAIRAGLIAKFAFEPNIMFVIGDPPNPLGRNQFQLVFFNENAKEWGLAFPGARVGKIYRGKMLSGGRWAEYFDTQEKRVRGLVNVAAHELGHIFGCVHNMHAPNDERALSAGGDGYTRTPGDGMLVGGAPGLMCDGHKVHADEIATQDLMFTGGATGTGGEKGTIIEFIRRIKAGLPPSAQPGPTVASLNTEFIEGLRADTETLPPAPPWDNPASPHRFCQQVDLMINLANNQNWEFGYMTPSGFFPIAEAGTPVVMGSADPGSPLDLAVRDVSVQDGPVRRMTQHGQVLNLGQSVAPNFSVMPVVTQLYFRQAALLLSTHDQGQTPPIFMQVSFSPYPDFYDGMRMVPGYCPGDFDQSGDVGVPDIFAFLAAWFAMDLSADIDGDGQTGVPDIFAFLAAWFAPCV